MNKELIKQLIASESRIIVITGSNGSGKTRLIERLKEELKDSANYLILDVIRIIILIKRTWKSLHMT